eukprot:1633864-Pyramimonas_sp.AAC.2
MKGEEHVKGRPCHGALGEDIFSLPSVRLVPVTGWSTSLYISERDYGAVETTHHQVLVWELITGGKRAYSWRGSQSQRRREHIPGAGANHRGEESIFLLWEPITEGKRAYSWCGSQSQGGREHIPVVGANHLGSRAALCAHQ